jgi:hypothetical protein
MKSGDVKETGTLKLKGGLMKLKRRCKVRGETRGRRFLKRSYLKFK